jgi:hypothetical protein
VGGGCSAPLARLAAWRPLGGPPAVAAGYPKVRGNTLSMFTDPSRPHQVFPLLKAKAKETEWLCRALAFVLP